MAKTKSKTKITRSHKKMDPDIKAVFTAGKALKQSSSERMLKANLEFIAGHFGYAIMETLPIPQECGCHSTYVKFNHICAEHSLKDYLERFRMPELDGE